MYFMAYCSRLDCLVVVSLRIGQNGRRSRGDRLKIELDFCQSVDTATGLALAGPLPEYEAPGLAQMGI